MFVALFYICTLYLTDCHVLIRFYIPIVRTLRSRSKTTSEKWVQKVDVDGTGQEVVRQMVPKERVLKYLPLGNYKW
jgi:alkaline phosphatase D